ncbi:hypothetical protein MKY48_26745 [Paenibacillus sp. FSL W8-0187]|jgi:hypothetical protein|uniref:YgiT-type zinc finger protein n=2 Tax=Paenibacillus lautus TaxID=1401 RepID=A0A1R1AWG4_PAELA|nr:MULTISPECIES: hypothetical protein [Paenibacillus]MBY0163144.1 hypothetical protein [Cytobacillus firmus]VTR30535.1 Uncharacterised protein [Actinobacillus pleuropneumoniae]ACX67345.1 conserved hypothetical protein [Paenibacillus sp. Y412MC10]AYB42551.1 hypothetical protein D5F53_04310 [Paenibacillus lautus]ETT68831.1 hypothetical protein C172_03822 [Paenibacillus sp. FSL H8-457]
MSFCCGASMMGTKGTLKHYRTQVHNVPLLSCPVCHRVEVHHRVENEYEILAEYAHGDGASQVDFQDYVMEDEDAIFENVVNRESEDPLTVVQSQIDMSLDLLVVAKWMEDEKWQGELKRRLAVMSQRRLRLQKQP